MDRAVWAVWYDLVEGSAEEYLAWMHQDYLPSLRQRNLCHGPQQMA